MEYRHLLGGGKKKNKKLPILKEFKEEIEKKPSSTTIINSQTVYLLPDHHGRKHTKNSCLLNNMFMNKWRDGKQAFSPATFLPKRAEILTRNKKTNG